MIACQSKVEVAISVVVANGYSGPQPLDLVKSDLMRDILKVTVTQIAIELDRRIGDEEDVLETIIVVIEESAALSKGFQVAHGAFLLGPNIVQAGGFCNVSELDAFDGFGGAGYSGLLGLSRRVLPISASCGAQTQSNAGE